MKNLWICLTSGLMAFLLVAAGNAAEVGEKAPDFTLKDSHGESHSLSDYEGQIVVLEWINHGCPFVTKFYEPGAMQEMQQSMAEQGVVWFSVCSSAPGTQGHMSPEDWTLKLRDTNSAAKAVLIDEDGKVGQSYGAVTTPHMYVIDPEGTLMYNGAIDSIRSANPLDIARADNYVVAAVEAIIEGRPVDVETSRPYGCTVKYASN